LFCFVAFLLFLFHFSFCFLFGLFGCFYFFFTYFRFVVGCCKRSGCFGEFNYTDKSTWNTRDRRNWCRMIQMVDIREEGSSCPNASILFVFVLFLFVFFVYAFNSKYLCGINEAPSVLQALRGTGGLAVTYTRHLNTSQPRNKHVEGIRAITNSDKRL